MGKVREEIERAWWKIDARTTEGQKMMPTPKHHRNLLGDKEKYLDAIYPIIQQHIPEARIYTEYRETRPEIYTDYSKAGEGDLRQAVGQGGEVDDSNMTLEEAASLIRQHQADKVREEIACKTCSPNGDCDSSPTLSSVAKHRRCQSQLEAADIAISLIKQHIPEEIQQLKNERDDWKATAEVASNPELSKLLDLDKFRQAIRDSREGKELDLTEEEFEVFCSIENYFVGKTASLIKKKIEGIENPHTRGVGVVGGWYAFDEALQAVKDIVGE